MCGVYRLAELRFSLVTPAPVDRFTGVGIAAILADGRMTLAVNPGDRAIVGIFCGKLRQPSLQLALICVQMTID